MNQSPVADWQQLSALYALADALDPASLDDWLVQLQAQAHPLLPQLQQMLAPRSQRQQHGFPGRLPRLPMSPAPRAIEWREVNRVGSYRLQQPPGSGESAEAWRTRRDDDMFQRQVAIKRLFRSQGGSGRDSFSQRFDRERDTLASLPHPHIAGLHDADVTPSGQPWLALESVEDEPLTAWCDARWLGVEARVRLFRRVLLAVQHAHANLAIHRDLNPGNILVTAHGDVRLLDSELTRRAGRPMTPSYASPEQLLGQRLTTACDVYVLGVVLYELLCGERPYELEAESAAQLEDAILDVEPRAPSRRTLSGGVASARGASPKALRRTLVGDLDAIVLHALAKQPGQRYGSVEALRADLDRWLDDRPVEARPPGTLYRLGKFVRRHLLGVSLGAVALAALLLVVVALQARQDERLAGTQADASRPVRQAQIDARLAQVGGQLVLDKRRGQRVLRPSSRAIASPSSITASA